MSHPPPTLARSIEESSSVGLVVSQRGSSVRTRSDSNSTRSIRARRSEPPDARHARIMQQAPLRQVCTFTEEELEAANYRKEDWVFEPLNSENRRCHYVITYFGPHMQEILQEMCRPPCTEEIAFFVCQHEIAPTTGAHHWQCYIEMTSSVRVGHLRQLFREPNLFLAARKGTPEDARNYCMQGYKRAPGPTSAVGPFYVGKYGGGRGYKALANASASMLGNCVQRVLAGDDPIQIAAEGGSDAMFAMRNHQYLQKLSTETELERAQRVPRNMCRRFYYGEAGTGKTTLADHEMSFLGPRVHAYRHQDPKFPPNFNGMTKDCHSMLVEDYNNAWTPSFTFGTMDSPVVRYDQLYKKIYPTYSQWWMTTNLNVEDFIDPTTKKNWCKEHQIGFYRRCDWIIHFTREEPDDCRPEWKHQIREEDGTSVGWMRLRKTPGGCKYPPPPGKTFDDLIGIVPVDWTRPTVPRLVPLPPPASFGVSAGMSLTARDPIALGTIPNHIESIDDEEEYSP
jgi:hypothetical protein